jgi:hypothetical protein
LNNSGIEMPRGEPPPRVEFDLAGSSAFAKRMGRTNSFVCTIEWSWSPANERMESYYLERGRSHWILWQKQYDDNHGCWRHPTAIARCLRDEIAERPVAMMLLAAALAEEIRHFNSDPGRFGINETGLLSMGELDAVAESIWGDRR